MITHLLNGVFTVNIVACLHMHIACQLRIIKIVLLSMLSCESWDVVGGGGGGDFPWDRLRAVYTFLSSSNRGKTSRTPARATWVRT